MRNYQHDPGEATLPAETGEDDLIAELRLARDLQEGARVERCPTCVSAADLRRYTEPARDGYPAEWPAIKDHVREEAGHRCIRCGHPYRKGEHGNGEWSNCDAECEHAGPIRVWLPEVDAWAHPADAVGPGTYPRHDTVQAAWRILTVHHLNGDKLDCRWWNLTALCQRCHLTIQGRVVMERRFLTEHSDWFKPYAAGWYAFDRLGEELTREETIERLDELLALEDRQLSIGEERP